MRITYEGPADWGGTAYPGDAGIDIPIIEARTLIPGEFADLRSGIRVAIPEGYYGRVAARSGALRNKRLRAYEGVIDSGYRGELFTYVENVGPTATIVKPGDRLAQVIIQPLFEIEWEQVEQLGNSKRGARGFGSSDTEAPKMIAVTAYMGGPIDFKEDTERDERYTAIRDRFPHLTLWDPKVQNQGVADPQTIWTTNTHMINDCDIGIFLFPDPATGYGFGSPIEIASMVAQGKPVIIWHRGDNVGVYLRKLWQDGAIVATDWQDFLRILDEEIAKVTRG